MDEFQEHGVDAFVIHPRVGLPREMGWMSHSLLDAMHAVIAEARRRGMWVILYDEGMYPSGSSSGQVVRENPAYQCRGLVRINLDRVQPGSVEQGVRIGPDGELLLADNQTLVAEVGYKGQRYAIVDRPVDAVIRGLHFIHENTDEPPEHLPPAADLLNPDAVACFIRLVYERYYEEFGSDFGATIQAIFTDEPMLLGRPREIGIVPGTTNILTYVNAYLGYDFTPYLPMLWDADADDTIKDDYNRALAARLEETYYARLCQWCSDHNIALTGHPAEPDAVRHLRYFHIPGQDIVWRQIEPDTPSALEGRQSTQAKAAASTMLHTGRRRNANEFCGAYGHDLTFDEMRWLANWLLIRGCNLLIPHAFYYSVRGPRKHERPPDVGIHSSWWDARFTAFAQACRRLCWLNTDSEHVCHIAILGEHHNLPWRAAKHCYENQVDFNYLAVDDFMNADCTAGSPITIGSQTYHVLIIDHDISAAVKAKQQQLSDCVQAIFWAEDGNASVKAIRNLRPAFFEPGADMKGLRLRHVRKMGFDWYMLFNEGAEALTCRITCQNAYLLNPYADAMTEFSGTLSLAGHELAVLARKDEDR